MDLGVDLQGHEEGVRHYSIPCSGDATGGPRTCFEFTSYGQAYSQQYIVMSYFRNGYVPDKATESMVRNEMRKVVSAGHGHMR
jgi:hypothetical protein